MVSQVWYCVKGAWKNLAGRSLVSDSDDGRNISRVAGVLYLTPHLAALISVLRAEHSSHSDGVVFAPTFVEWLG